MFNSSSLDTAPRRHYKRHANRKRNGYELTSQRDMFPIALGAGLASIMVYCLLYYYAPTIFAFEIKVINDYPDEVKQEYVRVVVKEIPEKKTVEAEPIEETEEPIEQEQLEQDPTEIDILDAELEELIMAPGDTDLTVPEPVPTQEVPSAVEEMKPTALDTAALEVPSVPTEALTMPEPTPINHNAVVSNATAQLSAVDESDKIKETELIEDARKGQNGALPDDNRSLADLIGEKNLGRSSGVARLGTDVLFGFNECKLKNSARITMLQLAALVQKNPSTKFIIEGHTDSIGGSAYNALLSLQRAAAVREWLRNNKVPTNNIYIRPCADNTPIVPTTGDRNAQAINRRVEIHMRKPTEPLPPGCEDHNYKVDLNSKLSAQLSAGVHIPKTYPAASKNNGVAPEQPAAKNTTNNRRNNNARKRR
ncbi:MAG: OmpA family protein [Akkermansia sp.]|nr:OmpA family protein [Akkermansia sp.]